MASASQVAYSMNIVLSSAIKGSNFLQASTKGIHTYAKKVENINLLRATKFPLLKKHLTSLDNHLAHIKKKALIISANPIKLDIKTSRDSLKEARKDMTAIEHDAKQVAFWTKKSAENLERGVRAYRQTTERKKPEIGVGAVGAAVAVGSAIAFPLKASIEFESKMARVKALSNATEEDFKALTQTAMKLGATTEWSAGQVAEGMQFLAMKGFTTNETIKAMPGLLSLATAGATDLGTASNISGSILKSFGLEASKMSEVSDILAKTITTSNVDMTTLGDTMKYIAPVAKTAGMSLQETAAMAGLLGNIGISGSMAGTTLKSMVLRLSSPVGEARKALNALGISALDAQGNIKNMPLLLKEVAEATKYMGSGERLGFIKKVFGSEPAAGINALIEKSGSGALSKYLNVVNDYKGSAKKIANIQLATTAGQFKLLGSAIEGLSISATTGLLPAIKYITQGVTGLTSKIQALTEKFPTATKWIFGLGAAFVVGSIALAGFGLVASGVGAGLALLTSPVTLVVAGLMAVGAAGAYLYTRFKGVREAVDGFFSGLIDGVSPIIKEFKTAFVELGGAIKGVFSPIFSIFGAVGGVLGTLGINFSNLGKVIGGAFSLALTPIKWTINLITFLLKVVGSAINFVKTPIVEFFNWIEEKLKGIFAFVEKAKNFVANPVKSAWSGIKSFFGFGEKKETIKTQTSTTATTAVSKKVKNSLPLKGVDPKKLPIESTSQITEQKLQEMRVQQQSSKPTINQYITNNITVQADEHGKVDYEDLKEKIKRALKDIEHDEQDVQLRDVS